MKKKILIYIASILVFFAVGCGSNYNSNSTMKDNDVKQSETVQEDEFKIQLENIKNKVVSTEQLTTGEWDKIADFISINKDREEVKGDLTNFVCEKSENCLKGIEQNKNTKERVEVVMSILFMNYKDNQRVQNLYHQYTHSAVVKEATQQEENKRQAEPSKLTSVDGNLELLNYSTEDGYIVGSIRNNSSKLYQYVEVNINLYDKNENQVESTMTNVTNLEPHKTWKFKAVVLNQKNVKSYKIVNINGN